MPIEVVNGKFSDYDVYVGRPSKWGNRFAIGRDGDRDQVIEKYKKWILNQPQLLKDLPELFNKRLACHCAPMRCHAEILKELAEEYEKRIKEFAI